MCAFRGMQCLLSYYSYAIQTINLPDNTTPLPNSEFINFPIYLYKSKQVEVEETEEDEDEGEEEEEDEESVDDSEGVYSYFLKPEVRTIL